MKKIILIILLINISCINQNRLRKEEKKIKDFLINQNKEAFNLELDTISSFQWDELLVAGPYMYIDSIAGKNYNLNKISSNAIQNNDRFILFCFLNKKKGVKYIELERHLFSDKVFENNMLGKIYSKDESKFLITKE